MIEFTRQWVVSIVALVLFIVMFEIMLPTGKMKKYVSLATGTILIIAIISPLTGLLGRNVDITALQASNSNYLDRLQVEKDSRLLKKQQMEQIVDLYREKIIQQLEQNAQEVDGVKKAKADVIFDEDYNSKTFGEIKRAYIKIESEDTGTSKDRESISGKKEGTAGDDNSKQEDISVKPVSGIRKVSIGDGTEMPERTEKCNPAVKKRLEDRISSVFGVNSSNIVISQTNNSQE